MMNCQNLPFLNKKSDEFVSYFSSIPELPQLEPSSSKKRKNSAFSFKNLERQANKKVVSISKRQYELDTKHSNRKKMKSRLLKKTLTASDEIRQLQSAGPKCLQVKASPCRPLSSRLHTSSKKGLTKNGGSEAKLNYSANTGSTRRQTLTINGSEQEGQLEEIYNRCSLLLGSYEQKLLKLEQQNRRLELSNKNLRAQLRAEKISVR